MKETELSIDDFLEKTLNKVISENKSVFEDFDKIDSQEYLASIKIINKSIDNRKAELNAEFNSEFYFEKCVLELVIVQHLQMLMILEKDFGLKFKKESKKENKANLFIVTSLMHQMNNNLVVFYKLLSDGFSFQANLIFRSVIEQGSTIFAILLDDDFLLEFKNNADIEDPKEKLKHWKKKLSPFQIDEILKKGYNEIESLQIFKDLLFEFKKWLYQDSSEFVHSQFLSSLLSSYSSKRGNDENIDLNLIGRIDSNIERICFRAIPYFNLFFDNFIKILISKFDYRFGDSGKKEGIKLWLVHKLTDEVGKEYIAKKNYS